MKNLKKTREELITSYDNKKVRFEVIKNTISGENTITTFDYEDNTIYHNICDYSKEELQKLKDVCEIALSLIDEK